MNAKILEIVKHHKKLNAAFVPNDLHSAIDLYDRYLELANTVNSIVSKPLLLADYLPLKINSALDRAINSAADIGAPFADYTAVNSRFSKVFDTANKIYEDFDSSVIERAVSVTRHLGSSVSTLFESFHLNNLSNITNLLQQPETSILSESFRFQKYVNSFLIPDYSDVAFEDDVKEQGGIIVEVGTSDLESIIKDFYKNQKLLRTIDPRKFEEVIAELFRHHGYQATLTKQTRDGGFDITLEKVLVNGTPFKALVECKRYNKKIGIETLRCFSAVAYQQQVRHGIIVTTSLFTRDAKIGGSGLPADLTLKDKTDIVKWAGSYIGELPVVDLDLSKPQIKNIFF